LVKAREGNVDNPIFQLFLDEWVKEHSRLFEKCKSMYDGNPEYGFGTFSPTISPAPSTASPTISPTTSAKPTVGISCEEKLTLSTLDQRIGGSRSDHEGIMFDVVNISEKDENDVLINAIAVNVQGEDPTTIQVFTTEGTWVGNEKPANDGAGPQFPQQPKAVGAWIDLGKYDVQGAGIGNPTLVSLREQLRISPNETVAFYIVQVDGNDNVQNIVFNDNEVGMDVAKDDHLSIKVGLAIEALPFSQEPDKEFVYGRGFSGSIDYTVCQRGGGGNVTTTNSTNSSGGVRSLLRARTLQNATVTQEDPKYSQPIEPFRLYPSPVRNNFIE